MNIEWIIPEWLHPALVSDTGKQYVFLVPCTADEYDYIAGMVSEDV